MKILVVLLLIGVCGYYGWKQYSPATADVPTRASAAADKARAVAAATYEAEGSPSFGPVEVPAPAAREPNQTLAELEAKAKAVTRDLGEKSELLVEKAKVAGERMDDTRIVAMIAAKLLLEKELPSRAITVECREGHVILIGSAPTESLRARAVKLVKETSGVVSVESRLVVK